MASGPLRSATAGPCLPSTAAVLQTATGTPGVGPGELADYGPAVVRAAWFLAGFLAVVFVGRLVVEPTVKRAVRRRNRNNPRLRDAVSLYVRVVFVVAGVVVGVGVAGYGRGLGSSALIIGAVTLALGVAGQELIGSLIGGTALVFDPEFNVGDYISWPGGEGTVRSIALRATRVATPNGELVTVPNTVLTNEPITRPFGRGNYRVVDRFAVGYDADVDEAVALFEAAAADLDAVLSEPSPAVYVDELGPDAVRISAHYWIEDPDRSRVFAVRSAYARAVKRRLEAADVEISPPAKREVRGRIDVGGRDDR
ncbi:mechanosensitive ion channel family protein [Halobaculum litoreum]|uniref:mechanosensitive ion channel family protein n=1 Tax=Halobaculum litoreum TaxID=3031998 RepID=UPI0024C437D7|nr:mechanosensitive ion channel family protein [Halobaculum sp. DT92]